MLLKEKKERCRTKLRLAKSARSRWASRYRGNETQSELINKLPDSDAYSRATGVEVPPFWGDCITWTRQHGWFDCSARHYTVFPFFCFFSFSCIDHSIPPRLFAVPGGLSEPSRSAHVARKTSALPEFRDSNEYFYFIFQVKNFKNERDLLKNKLCRAMRWVAVTKSYT